MARRSNTSIIVRGLTVALCGFLFALIGCSTPRQRYQVLSVFFDGVPNPDAPKKIFAVAPTTGPTVVHAVILSVHKPYQDPNGCNVCHRGDNGEIQDFELAYNKCVRCHPKTASSHKLMHGPVAREACKWCHTPHESAQLHLLKDTSIKVCTQCHDQQLLSNFPPQHTDGKTDCLTCHNGHGGDQRYFLKPLPQPQTQPAPNTQPAPAPATQKGAAP